MSRLPSAHFLQISRVVLTGFDLLFDFKKCQFSCKLKTEIKPFRPILTEIVAVCFHFLFNSFVFYLFDKLCGYALIDSSFCSFSPSPHLSVRFSNLRGKSSSECLISNILESRITEDFFQRVKSTCCRIC